MIKTSKKRPCRIESSSSDSSLSSSSEDSTVEDENVEESSDDDESDHDGAASDATESQDTPPREISCPIPTPDDPPQYIQKKMRLKKSQNPTHDPEIPELSTIVGTAETASPGKTSTEPTSTPQPSTSSAPVCSANVLTLKPFEITEVPASISQITGPMLQRIDALRDFVSYINTSLDQIENKKELSPVNDTIKIVTSAHEYVNWLQRMATFLNIPGLPSGLMDKVSQLHQSISEFEPEDSPFIPYGTLVDFARSIKTNGARLRSSIYEALKKAYTTPPRKVQLVEPTTGDIVTYVAAYVEQSPEKDEPLFHDLPSPSSSSDTPISDEAQGGESSFVYWQNEGSNAPRKLSYSNLDNLVDPVTGKIPRKECADAIKRLRPTLSRDAKLIKLNTSTRKLMAGVKRGISKQPEPFDDFIQDCMADLATQRKDKDPPVA